MPHRTPRSVVRALRRRLRRSSPPGPSVTVVVVVEPVDRPRLGAALASVRDQHHPRVDVLVCPVGAGPGDLAPQGTWQAAATAGAAAARGDLLVFLRGCDVLPPGSLALAAATLARSGSVLASGRVDQAGEPELWWQHAQRAAHAVARTAHPTGGGPRLLLDLTLVGTVIRRTAWSGLDPDDDWLLSTTVARLLTGPGTTDLLDEPTYTWSPDHGTRPYGAMPSPLPGLASHRERLARIDRVLTEGVLAERWRRTVAGAEVPALLQDAERADAAEWVALRDLARSVAAAPRWWAGVGAAARALVHLAAEDRRADLEVVAAEHDALGGELRTELTADGEVRARWPVELPVELRTLPAAETRLRARVSRVGRPGPDRRADLLLAVDGVDLARSDVVVEVRGRGGAVLDTRPLDPAEATRWHEHRFEAAVGVSVLVPGRGATPLRATVTVGGLARTARAHLPEREPLPDAPVRVEDLRVDGDTLVLTASGAVADLHLLWRDRRVGETTVPGDGTVRIRLVDAPYGDPTPLPPGSYRVVVGDGDNVRVGADLRARLPEANRGVQRVRAHLGPRGGLVLELAPPLDDLERGAYAQQRLQTAYASTAVPVDPDLWYFESYAGRTPTDSPLAVYEELRRRRPGLRACWGIADAAHRAPAGATPVLLRSREWYDVLARAGRIVTNTDTEAWFRRRPGQVLLQTFHGYPSKAMGAGQWAALDYPPRRIRDRRARGVDTWSVILTPTPEMTRHYREQYGYTGPALEHGYPRNDALVAPEASARRTAVRRRLGIADDQVAVLYAPTWREHLAFRPRGAAMTEHLDLVAAAEALGESHVLLLRGHRFHAPPPVVAGGARVVDVTAYPEVNDLILAADASVLDYSSMRFDVALTGRPMVFLVPDLADYAHGSRRFLFPFEESAPGPLVVDTAGVVEQLLDPGLAERWAGPIADFNAHFNPWQDGHAASRVVDGLERLLADGS